MNDFQYIVIPNVDVYLASKPLQKVPYDRKKLEARLPWQFYKRNFGNTDIFVMTKINV